MESDKQSSGLCAKCGKPAAITLRYMPADLCQSHFVRLFEARVKRTVRQHRMLKKGERIAVGLSGGKDSCVMLHMLHKISQSLPIELHAITIDEGIEGYRSRTLEIAKEQCSRLGVPLTVVSFREEFQSTLDGLLEAKGAARACTYCGVMRRHLLNKYARELGADKIAIGHNADDVAQTVMMNLMRNEPERLGRFGLTSGAVDDEAFVKRIKPLFTTPERDVAAYAVMKGIQIEFAECPYAKNAFRQYIRKMLNEIEGKYPGTKLRVVRAFLEQSRLMLDGARYRIEKAGSFAKIGRCKSCGEPSSGKTCSLCLLLERG
ncbi:MAG: TIGR00269 family protein [Candidatus Micrarchaeota archaeon]|nr:TIGR00269 family protein [Candidatus Micrarchaeota archaeon]